MNYIAVDIGTENLRIGDTESGRIYSEPTLIAVSAENERICAVGQEAKELMERVPGRYRGISPVKAGMIADYNMLQVLLAEIIKKRKKGFSLVQPKAVVAVPAGLSAMHKREFEDVLKASGVREVILIDAPVAGCVGMGEDVSGATAHMVLSVGAGISEIAVVCMNRLVAYRMFNTGGQKFNEAIAQKIRRELDIWIGGCMTESLKRKIGLEELNEFQTICGKNIVTGLPMMASISSMEIARTLSDSVRELTEGVREVLYGLPEELIRDIQKNGILLVGGSVKMNRFVKFVEKELGFPVHKAVYSENAVINGALQAATDLGGYKRIAEEIAEETMIPPEI